MNNGVKASRYLRCWQVLTLAATCFLPLAVSLGQGAKQTDAESSISDTDADHLKERNEWFYRGRVVRGLPAAELRRRAYQAKLQLRAKRAMAMPYATQQLSFSVGSWAPLGPVPLASDASGNGTQDYHQVAGRATAVAIDPADSSGNTVYIGGAQSGVWKSTNAANPVASNVAWTPITDNQATLSIGQSRFSRETMIRRRRSSWRLQARRIVRVIPTLDLGCCAPLTAATPGV